MATPSTRLNILLDLHLGTVPSDIQDPAVYEALINIHNTLETLAFTSVGESEEGGFTEYLARERAISVITTNYNITSADKTILLDASANTVTGVLPTASAVTGYVYEIKCVDDTFTATVDTVGADKLDDSAAVFELILHESITVKSDGTDWWII